MTETCPNCKSKKVESELAYFDGSTGKGGVDVYCLDCGWHMSCDSDDGDIVVNQGDQKKKKS